MQDHAFLVRFTVRKRQSEVAVEKFSGVDRMQIETKHLKDMVPIVQQIRVAEVFDEGGVAGARSSRGGYDGGWARMMADKALGYCEVGPFDVYYPKHDIRVGDGWQRSILCGDELFYNNPDITSIRGNGADCHYHLVHLDLAKNTADVAFTVEAHPSVRVPKSPLGPEYIRRTVFRESGTWTIDIRTGFPIRFKARRTYQSWDRGLVELEETTTSAQKL